MTEFDSASALVMDRPPKYQNVAAIFEESPEGKAQMQAFLNEAPHPWREYIEARLPKIRAVPIRYIGFLGNLNSAGVVTAAARNEDELLAGLVPWFVERLMTNGGMCPFVLSVREPVKSAIRKRLEELEPATGEDGELIAAPLLGELRGSYGVQSGPQGLPAQATPAQVDPMNPSAVWGGRHIAPGRIAYASERLVQDADAFQRAVFKVWLVNDPDGLAKLRAAGHEPFVFEAMPNGVLRVTGIMPSGPITPIEFGVDEWLEDQPD